MAANSYVTNHNFSQPEIIDILSTGFTGMLHSWWEKHLTPDSRSSIKHVIKRDEDETAIFDERT